MEHWLVRQLRELSAVYADSVVVGDISARLGIVIEDDRDHVVIRPTLFEFSKIILSADPRTGTTTSVTLDLSEPVSLRTLLEAFGPAHRSGTTGEDERSRTPSENSTRPEPLSTAHFWGPTRDKPPHVVSIVALVERSDGGDPNDGFVHSVTVLQEN